MKYSIYIVGAVILIVSLCLVLFAQETADQGQSNKRDGGGILTANSFEEKKNAETNEIITASVHPMAIEELRRGTYPGSVLEIEEELANGSNYKRYIASYLSEGLKIYGLLTVPLSKKPENGYPSIVFIHGYIPPDIYSTINSYPTYQARLARAGFITFKPDLRGHGDSQGEPVSAHYSEKYVVDTLNAISSLKTYSNVDVNNIGYWGHSNGGEIGLRTILVNSDIKAASFWAGVVGSYQDMFETYIDSIPFLQIDENPLVAAYGLPSTGGDVWKAIEPFNYLSDISIPVQLQHGTEDDSVPVELSQSLYNSMQEAGVTVEYIEYTGDDHNISQNVTAAWESTIEFYNQHLIH